MMPDLDPNTDLSFTRTLAVPRHLIWECWTQPKHIPHFFIPAPHKITAVDIDLRVGGRFNTSFEVDGVQYIAVQSGWGIDAAGMQRDIAVVLAHPQDPVQQMRAPKAHFAADRNHGAMAGRDGNLMAGTLPELDEGRRVAQELFAGRGERRAALVAHE